MNAYLTLNWLDIINHIDQFDEFIKSNREGGLIILQVGEQAVVGYLQEETNKVFIRNKDYYKQLIHICAVVGIPFSIYVD